jgi:hypothetical protein
MLTNLQELELLDLMAQQTNRAAYEALDMLLKDLQAGYPAKTAIERAQASFTSVFTQHYASALGEVLGVAVPVSAALAMPIGFATNPVKLSTVLYRQSQQIEANILQLINTHMQGLRDSNKLALDLFDGYVGGQTEPLKAKQIKSIMPQWIQNDAAVLSKYEQAIYKAQSQLLKTPALRAAYEQLLESIGRGAGQKKLENALKVAYAEKNRYLANRVAQTELHRLQAREQHTEWANDPDVEYIKIELATTHPQSDICDLYAKIDRYGLGAGVYPKDEAPMRPFHPFCRCIARPMWGLTGEKTAYDDGAEKRYIKSLGAQEQRDVMGGQTRLEQVLKGGVSATDAYNASRDDGYKIAPFST